MSFGRPGALADTFKVAPPQRGSFPLDHDGECKTFMISYMRCLKGNKSDSGACRVQARDYLECRMDHGLMTRDDMVNLGLGDVLSSKDGGAAGGSAAGTSTTAASAASAGGKSAPGAASMERI